MNAAELQEILIRHKKWINGETDGIRADLCDVNLSRVDMRGVDLRNASLSGADLSDVNLSGSDLRGADLSWARLVRADLSYALLRQAVLGEADLTDATLPHFQICPEIGEFRAWKCVATGHFWQCDIFVKRVAIPVLVPADAKRTSNLINRKVRVSKVIVISGRGYSPTWPNQLLYESGMVVEAHEYNDDIRDDCAPGIHIFMTKREAEEWEE